MTSPHPRAAGRARPRCARRTIPKSGSAGPNERRLTVVRARQRLARLAYSPSNRPPQPLRLQTSGDAGERELELVRIVGGGEGVLVADLPARVELLEALLEGHRPEERVLGERLGQLVGL